MTPSWGGTDKCGLVGNVATDEDSAHVIEQANMFPCEKDSAYHAYRWAATMFDHNYKQNRMFTNALRDSTNYDIEETYEDSLGLKSFGYVSSNGALADKNIAVMWHYFPDDFYYGEHLSSVDVELQNITEGTTIYTYSILGDPIDTTTIGQDSTATIDVSFAPRYFVWDTTFVKPATVYDSCYCCE